MVTGGSDEVAHGPFEAAMANLKQQWSNQGRSDPDNEAHGSDKQLEKVVQSMSQIVVNVSILIQYSYQWRSSVTEPSRVTRFTFTGKPSATRLEPRPTCVVALVCMVVVG